VTDEEVSDAMLAARLQDAARRVEDGRKAQAERARLILEAHRRGWTREQIAAHAGMSHQAVTQRIQKHDSTK